MPTSFRIKLDQGRWVPEAPGLADQCYFNDDGVTSREVVRESMFSAINNLFPGQYTLDYDVVFERDDAFRRIDRRSDDMIESGFPFDGATFSLSVEAQVRYATMMMLADKLTYPLTINSLDDRSSVDLQSGDHTRAFCLSAMGYVKNVVDSGSAQKAVVRELTDVNELVAYQDPR